MFEDYVNKIKSIENKRIYCYGAGKVAHIIWQICSDNHIEIKGFCVTDIYANKNEMEGLPVIAFDQLKRELSDIAILIGVWEKGEKKLKKFILEEGGKCVIDLPDDIWDYDIETQKRKARPTLEVTPIIGCSVNCHYCPQKLLLSRYFQYDKQRKRKLSFEEYKIILDKLPRNTLIEFTGFVEPFLHDAAVDMMEYTYKMGFEMTLFTTLVGLDEFGLARVLKFPFSKVCLHTPDEKEYANIPITKQYLKMLEKVVNATNEDGTPFVTIANCQSAPHADILPITKGKLKIWTELTDRAGSLDKADANLAHAQKTGKLCCVRANNLDHFVLLPDGSVVLCCNDFGLQHLLGNLLTQSYSDIIHSEEMRKIKRGMVLDESIPIICRNCVYAQNI